MTEFEDSVLSASMPVNSIAGANRLIDLLHELKTNSLNSDSAKTDYRVRALIYFFVTQLHGFDDLNLYKEYNLILALRDK